MLSLGLYLAPFVACDFYYIFNDPSCIFFRIQNYSIRLTLKQWLYVDALTMTTIFLIVFVSAIIASWMLTNNTPYIVYSASVGVLGFWRAIWLIVGGIMFWGDLNKRGICSKSISAYMWANLIIGFAGIPLFYIAGCCFAKVQPVAVAVIDHKQPTERQLAQ